MACAIFYHAFGAGDKGIFAQFFKMGIVNYPCPVAEIAILRADFGLNLGLHGHELEFAGLTRDAIMSRIFMRHIPAILWQGPAFNIEKSMNI
ncbi:MAG TPA: hypothetical protein PKX40_13260 [Spirochaetota bacterium]|jgi:hypothetical protein|nr:hypothetical protein [Spirochaetota bacterium]